jgi:hypothetical protein
MTAWALAFATAVILFVGPGLPLLARRISRVYAVYFSFAFVLRSVLLVTIEPAPASGSAFVVADLAAAGYDSSVPQVLPYASASGLGLFAALWLVTRLPISRRQVELTLPVSQALFIYAAATILRLLATVVPDSGLIARLGSLGQTACVVILAGIVLGTDWRAGAQRLVLCLAITEVVFSVLSASKTPLLTVLLLVYLDPRRPKLSMKVLLAGAAALIVAFTSIQSLKSSGGPEQTGNLAERAFFSMAGRLDGLFALAGVWRQGSGLYHPEGGMAASMLRAVLPGWLQVGDKELAGRLWGINIYRVDNGTSYAEGLAGEGLAIGGELGPLWWGVAGGVLLGAAILAAASRFRLIQFTALAFLASTATFERGLLGQLEQISAAAQAAALIVVALALIGSTGRAVPTRVRELKTTSGLR